MNDYLSNAVCRWEKSTWGCWMTDCEWTFEFNVSESDVSVVNELVNEFNFCPFCGRELVASGC